MNCCDLGTNSIQILSLFNVAVLLFTLTGLPPPPPPTPSTFTHTQPLTLILIDPFNKQRRIVTVLLLYRQNELRVKPEGEDNYLHTVPRFHANSSPAAGCSVRFPFVNVRK